MVSEAQEPSSDIHEILLLVHHQGAMRAFTPPAAPSKSRPRCMLGRLLVANFHSNKLGEDVTASISVRSRIFAAAKLFDTMLKGLIDADAVVLLEQ